MQFVILKINEMVAGEKNYDSVLEPFWGKNKIGEYISKRKKKLEED